MTAKVARPAPEAEFPMLRHLAVARRLTLLSGLAALVLVGGATVVLASLAGALLPWVVGAVLLACVVGVVVVGAHAGGHGLFVPLPVLVLAAIWALVGPTWGWSSPAAWLLAALALVSSGAGALLVLPALAARHMVVRPGAVSVGVEALVGSSGVTLTPLSPGGTVRAGRETWTALSLSGLLPAGVPVHVARVEGVRLLVWSEHGTVPGLEALEGTHQANEKEEA